MRITKLLSTTALVCASTAFAVPAFAQGIPTPPECAANDPNCKLPDADASNPTKFQSESEIESGTDAQTGAQGDDAIVVTGSRIRRPNLESTVPITSVGGEEIFERASISVGDLLNDLPSLRSTFSQSNSSRFLGTAGLSLLDLRGLGTQRTLVLVNGRRHVGADILSNAVSPDINTFPTDLIERIDVVTGGNSAIYGSDAIAGVVNFVLKRNFDGVQIRGQGGITKYGDAGAYFVSAVAGTNFAESRGNIAINLEYARQNPAFGSGRPNLRQASGFIVVDTDVRCTGTNAAGQATPVGCDPAVDANNADGVFDRVFARDVRSTTSSLGGLLQIAPTGGRAPCGRDANGVAFVCTYLFQADGSFIPETGTRTGIAPNGSFIGGNGFTGREGSQLSLYPTLDRYSVNVIGHFDVSDAFRPFIEAKYVRTDSRRFGTPAFFSGSTIGGGVDLRERPRFDNPFLTDSARTAINEARVANGLAPATAATRLSLRRTLLDLGGREEEARRETYRIVGGVTGDFNDDWRYEASLNYGEFKERTKVLGNLNQQRFLLAIDTTRNAAGQIVCRSQVDPAAAQIYPFLDNEAFGQARLAADVAACVPLNPFGEASITPAARNYLVNDTTSVGSIKQFVASASVSGDSSQAFELPGGPIGFALGAEYRRERNYFKADDLVASGITFYNALPLFDPPAFEVKELFGEVRVPILKDLPFFHELTVSGAARVSDYKGKTGTVYAYNGGVDFAPIQDIRFRASYGRSVRAPNLSDQFSAQSQNFAPGFADPCSTRNIGTGSATRAANCAAAGRPADFDFVYSSSLGILSGGNPDLTEETSDSITAGAIIQPRFLRGFSLSADYFDIKVNNVITAPSAQQIVNACYDAVDLNNQFCSLFQRAGAGGAPTGEEPFRIIEGGLQQTVLNYAKLKVRGIDVEAAFRRDFARIGKFSTKFRYTHVLQNDSFLNPADPGRADQTLLELGDPKDAFNWNSDIQHGALTLGYQLRYIGKMVLNTYEDFFSKQGRLPENADYADRRFYPSVFYHDIRFGIDATDRFNFYGGVNNLLNKKPPFGLTGTGGGSAIYDARGQTFYAGAKAKF